MVWPNQFKLNRFETGLSASVNGAIGRFEATVLTQNLSRGTHWQCGWPGDISESDTRYQYTVTCLHLQANVKLLQLSNPLTPAIFHRTVNTEALYTLLKFGIKDCRKGWLLTGGTWPLFINSCMKLYTLGKTVLHSTW